ncbi:ROK family protein [Nonomuraea sp. NPDC050536]|uniref:ROK family protein n=1 Tax=Nonomuraea sp. NPDC050536 TaxID=3364366 RepID=UPI0037C5192A
MRRYVKPLSLPAPPLDGLVLAIDVGGTRVRTAVVDGAGTIHHRREIPTPQDAAKLVEEVVSEARAALRPGLLAIGVSAPGPLDRAAGAIEVSANLPEVPLAEPLGALGPPVVIERDTNVAALGEATFGAARGVADFAYVTVSTGIGASIVYGGRLLTGAHGYAGEIGHFPVDPGGPRCGCGNRGCLEALASGSGIAAGGVPAPTVAARELEGDASAAAIMEWARAAFAAGMVGLVNAYDPGLVVVGGGVADAQGERLLEPARRAVRRHAYGAAARGTRIVAAALGGDGGLLGAVPLVALSGTRR